MMMLLLGNLRVCSHQWWRVAVMSNSLWSDVHWSNKERVWYVSEWLFLEMLKETSNYFMNALELSVLSHYMKQEVSIWVFCGQTVQVLLFLLNIFIFGISLLAALAHNTHTQIFYNVLYTSFGLFRNNMNTWAQATWCVLLTADWLGNHTAPNGKHAIIEQNIYIHSAEFHDRCSLKGKKLCSPLYNISVNFSTTVSNHIIFAYWDLRTWRTSDLFLHC